MSRPEHKVQSLMYRFLIGLTHSNREPDMQTQFYVSHAGEQQGPHSVEMILKMVESTQLSSNDYCYCEQKEEWVILIEHPMFSEKLQALAVETMKHKPVEAPKMPSKPAAPTDSAQIEWFVLKGQNKFGPFTQVDVVKMLQEKSIFEFDYVWHAAMSNWMRIAELEEYAPEKIRHMQSSNQEGVSEIFFRRRHLRVEMESSIIVHDNKHVWKGKSLEVSSGGAGLEIENALLHPGQTLFLHFKPADGLPPFNAVCEVVSKQFVKGLKSKESPIKYGVKFTSIHSAAQKNLNELATRKTATKAA